MVELASTIWADGPSFLPHQPSKSQIRAWGTWLENLAQAFISTGGKIYANRAGLDADLTPDIHSTAWVLGDPVAANNGIYEKLGLSGSGSWKRLGDLPYSFIVAEDNGSGTPNAIQAYSALPISSSALVLLNIYETSGPGQVTVRFNNEGPSYVIKTNSGNEPADGGLVGGSVLAGRTQGSEFRLISDQASTAVLAAAEAAADRAEAAAEEAEAIADFEGLADEEVVKQGSSSVEAPSVLSLVERLKYDGYLSVRHFGVRLDGTDESVKWEQALAESVALKVPAIGTTIPIYQPLEIAQVGGIIGDGEGTAFERRFSGGPVVKFGGGEPITLKDFSIRSAAGQTITGADQGVEIGFDTPWAQRGDIRNILISGQWVGFRWKAGTEGDIVAVRCIDNLASGFVGVNPRGRLVRCLSQYNGRALSDGNGSAYFMYFQDPGETGITLEDCFTFGNYEYGLFVSGAVAGANVTLVRGGSSYDRLGGVRIGDTAVTQFYSRGSFIEYAGSANQFVDEFDVQPTAVGMFIGAGVTTSDISDLTTIHNNGTGCIVAGANDVSISDSRFTANGQGGAGGGLSVVSGVLAGVTKEAQKINISDVLATGNATIDIGVALGATGSLKGARAGTLSLAPNTGFVVSDVSKTVPEIPSAASANVVTLPSEAEIIKITGSTPVNAIAASWAGRRVTLIFQASVTVANANNVILVGAAGTAFAATANDTLTLVCDGANWVELSRSVNRDA